MAETELLIPKVAVLVEPRIGGIGDRLRGPSDTVAHAGQHTRMPALDFARAARYHARLMAAAEPTGPDPHAEADALLELVRQRYGSRLRADQLDGVKKGIQAVVEGARALRAVRLDNGDEPFQPFAPYRSDA